jgi:SEC-C motif-containing protein
MRARYSAFALGNVEFLLTTGPHEDGAGLARQLQKSRWVRLQVESTEAGQADDAEGFVTFRATFVEEGQFGELNERSRFARKEGCWRYVDGQSTVRPLRVGRNDACPCGSGKKAKSCHG